MFDAMGRKLLTEPGRITSHEKPLKKVCIPGYTKLNTYRIWYVYILYTYNFREDLIFFFAITGKDKKKMGSRISIQFDLKDESKNPINKLQEYCAHKMLPFKIEVGDQAGPQG